MKPIAPDELLKTIKDKLNARHEAGKITEEKLVRWTQNRARKVRSSEFQEFLRGTADELAAFGLTKTQAKIYVVLVALGVASASEIGTASNVRREEVYRIVPELEKRGIVVRKLDAPRKFSAVKPEVATSLLMKDKLKTMKDEVDSLTLKQLDLVPRLKNIALPTPNNDCSLELITKEDVAAAKLMDMTIRAKRQIDLITSPGEFRMAYLNRSKSLRDRLLRTVHLRVIFPECRLDSSIRDIIKISERCKNKIEVRYVEKIPFNVLISDEKEAMWGDVQTANGNVKNLWTDDPTQVSILTASFDSFWQKSRPYE